MRTQPKLLKRKIKRLISTLKSMFEMKSTQLTVGDEDHLFFVYNKSNNI